MPGQLTRSRRGDVLGRVGPTRRSRTGIHLRLRGISFYRGFKIQLVYRSEWRASAIRRDIDLWRRRVAVFGRQPLAGSAPMQIPWHTKRLMNARRCNRHAGPLLDIEDSGDTRGGTSRQTPMAKPCPSPAMPRRRSWDCTIDVREPETMGAEPACPFTRRSTRRDRDEPIPRYAQGVKHRLLRWSLVIGRWRQADCRIGECELCRASHVCT